MNEHRVKPEKMWEEFLLNKTEYIGRELSESYYFCDNKEDADELANLVVSGIKTANTSLYELYELEDEEESIPREGELSIITDFSGNALAVIENISVRIIPFNKVSEEFAYKEGEGDRTLSYWRKVHRDFFTKELEKYSKEFNEDMLVVLEEFKVVYKREGSMR